METIKKFELGEIALVEAVKPMACPQKPRGVTLRMKVDGETKRSAERMTRSYARQDLEVVLAAFVEDLAVAAERPGSWESEKVTAWLTSHPWPCPQKEDDLCQ